MARQFLINNGVKINAKYYINKVLKPFLKKDVPRLFPGRENDMLFHQDSVYCPAIKMTINYLNERKVNCITPTESMLKSPYAALLTEVSGGILKLCCYLLFVICYFESVGRNI
jgi:hypothetical protein